MQSTTLASQESSQHHSDSYATICEAASLEGRHIILGRYIQYPPSIEAGDLVEVDFNVRTIFEDSLYLLVCNGDHFAGGKPYAICRRFQRIPGGLRVDQTGHGQWEDFVPEHWASYQVCGRIKTVFKPAKAISRWES